MVTTIINPKYNKDIHDERIECHKCHRCGKFLTNQQHKMNSIEVFVRENGDRLRKCRVCHRIEDNRKLDDSRQS